jgi:hypothetical protein
LPDCFFIHPLRYDTMRVCFVLGSLAAITGGNAIVLQHARAAAAAGWQVTVTALQAPASGDARSFGLPDSIRVASLPDAVRAGRYDLLVATFWKTVYALPEFDAGRWLYFVQSIETRFVPLGRRIERAAADLTYLVDMPVVTTATWLRAFLADRFGRESRIAPVFFNADAHRPDGTALAPRRRGALRVLVEGPLRMRLKNVPRTLNLARRSKASEIWLMTQSEVPFYPGVDRLLTRVPPERTGDVYRSCDVVLRLSFVEGVYLVPLEMMACGGTTVTYDVSGHDDFVVDGTNGLVLRTGDEAGVVAALDRLAGDPDLVARLQEGALHTARTRPTADESSQVFLAAMADAMTRPFDVGAARRTVRRLRKMLMGSEEAPPAAAAARHAPQGDWHRFLAGLLTVVQTHAFAERRRPDIAGFVDF